jgi:hypothetical protein
MSGSLSGLGIPQPQITQTFQPARSVENRENQETQRQQDETNGVSSSNEIGISSRSREVQQVASSSGSSSEQQSSASSGRGSIINITV